MSERLTERDEYGNADIIGVDSSELQGSLEFDELNLVTNALNKLADYEDAERYGCVVALPFKIGDRAYWMTHFGKMKANGTVVDILIREGDVLVGINAENGSGTRKSTKDILYFQEAEAERAAADAGKGENRAN